MSSPGNPSSDRRAPSAEPAPASPGPTRSKRTALYFIASPLQYLAAKRIATHFEAGARQVLVWYKPGLDPMIRPDEWDAASYMPWPRLFPEPGPFGRHRRLQRNIRLVADLLGHCEELHIHSAVFDTEAINYFLRALPKLCGARVMHARILPDGVISMRRYPLSPLKRAAQYLRKLRRLADPRLDYWCFGGDRIGSDAPFCDRIYVLSGLPHEYPAHKVVVLPPLVDARPQRECAGGAPRALVIGQPLVGAGLMSPAQRDAVTARIRDWLRAQGVTDISYKRHPKDPNGELGHPDYQELTLDEPLELWMSRERYDIVVGVRSSALLLARQIYGEGVRIAAFGWDAVNFKSDAERATMAAAFASFAVEFPSA